MKRTRALLLASAVVAALSIQPTPAAWSATTLSCGPTILKPDGKPWTCRFADEFTGTKLSPTRWVAQTHATGAPKMGTDCWVDSTNNIAVKNGRLQLTSRKESKPFVCKSPFGDFTTQYTSGSVSTRGKFSQAFGRWEIRAKFPDAKVIGSQSAFWLVPYSNVYGAWPLSGEIDIAEYYTKYPDRAIPYIHYDQAVKDGTQTNTRCMIADPWNLHTYTLVWTRGRITISIDGVTCVDHVVSPLRTYLPLGAPFDQPFVTYLTQNLGVGQNAFDASLTPLPLRTEVDWVHVWS